MTEAEFRTLAQSWVHSHEEDQGDQVVFRSSSIELPPSRGRRGFELNPDGSMSEFGPGPADRPAASSGRWQLLEDGSLAFYPAGSSKPSRVTQIVSVAPDKLVLRKKSQ